MNHWDFLGGFFSHQLSGQVVEYSPCGWEVMGFTPDQVIPKTLKTVPLPHCLAPGMLELEGLVISDSREQHCAPTPDKSSGYLLIFMQILVSNSYHL